MHAVAVGEEDHIVSMSVSPSEETVVCATASQQLIVHTLSSSDLTKVYTHIHTVYPRYTYSRRERECAVGPAIHVHSGYNRRGFLALRVRGNVGVLDYPSKLKGRKWSPRRKLARVCSVLLQHHTLHTGHNNYAAHMICSSVTCATCAGSLRVFV